MAEDADGISVTWVNLPEFQTALELTLAKVQAVTPLTTKAAGLAIAALIQTHMHGRPGPNYVSGNLYDSLTVTSDRGSGLVGNIGGWTATITDTADYAARIEFGFKGTDSKGRRYPVPYPYPYFVPGIKDAEDSGILEKLFEDAWGAAWVEG